MFLLKGLNSEKHAKKKQTKTYIPTSLSWLVQYSLPWRLFTIKTLLKKILAGASVVFICLFWVILVLIFNFRKKIRDNRKKLNLVPLQWEFTSLQDLFYTGLWFESNLHQNFKYSVPFSPISFSFNNGVLWDQAGILCSYSPSQIPPL